MVLTASQYSVLDAKRIERLDADTFRCYVGGLKLFSLEVEPVITVSVTVQERGPTVRLLSTQVGGQAASRSAGWIGVGCGCLVLVLVLLGWPLSACRAATWVVQPACCCMHRMLL